MYNDPTLARSDFFAHIDTHFAGFMAALSSGGDDAAVKLAAALVSHSLRQGDICVDLENYAGQNLISESAEKSTIKCPSMTHWRRLLIESGIVGEAGEYKPLIMDARNRLYLHRYWEYEQQLAGFILERAARPLPDAHLTPLQADVVGSSLQRLFTENDTGDMNWQKVAAVVALLKPLCVISGGPGTGKTHAVARILVLLLEQYRRLGLELTIKLAAPTGKAASRLTAAISTAKRSLPCDPAVKAAIPDTGLTIHRMLRSLGNAGRFHYNAENRLPADVVVVDEASMVDLPLMSKLVQALSGDSRLVLLGDRDQLASVEAGAVMGDICGESRANVFSAQFRDQVKAVANVDLAGEPPAAEPPPGLQDCRIHLSKSYRFDEKSGIPKLSQAVNLGKAGEVVRGISRDTYGDVRWRALDRGGVWLEYLKKKVVAHYGRLAGEQDPARALERLERFKILCALNHGPYGVASMNARATTILENLTGQTGHHIGGDSVWYHGRPVLIRKNDHQLELYNGDLGIAMGCPGSTQGLSVYFRGGESGIRRFAPHRLPVHETAYAMTIHKSQGSEFDEVLMVLPERDSRVLTRELIYTGITRARQNLSILCSESAISLAVSRSIKRISGLRDKLAVK